jgi:hypothetical protein
VPILHRWLLPQVDIASISGGAIPWDEASTSGDFYTAEAKKFMEDGEQLLLALQLQLQQPPEDGNSTRHVAPLAQPVLAPVTN